MTSAEGPPRPLDTGPTPDQASSPVGGQGGDRRDEDEDHIGIFASWRSLYVTVILYTVALAVVLYALTRLLDYSS